MSPEGSALLQRMPYGFKPLLPEERFVLDGTYTKVVPKEDLRVPCRRCPDYAPEGGLWKLQFDRGVFRIFHGSSGWKSIGSFVVADDRLFLFNDPVCHELTCVYTSTLEDNQLVLLKVVEDDCAIRRLILISGERYILVRAASMSVEFFDLVASLYRDRGADEAHAVASNILFDVSHNLGMSDARIFHSRMNLRDPVDRLAAGPVHFAQTGWAYVNILPESRPATDDGFYLIYEHPFSFESDARIFHSRMNLKDPVDRLAAGPVHFAHTGWAFVNILPGSRPATDDDVHLFNDSFEVLQAAARSGESAPLLFTSLRPASPKLLINRTRGACASGRPT